MIPKYLYSETLSILCPLRLVTCRQMSAISLVPENIMNLAFFCIEDEFQVEKQILQFVKNLLKKLLWLFVQFRHSSTGLYHQHKVRCYSLL